MRCSTNGLGVLIFRLVRFKDSDIACKTWKFLITNGYLIKKHRIFANAFKKQVFLKIFFASLITLSEKRR